MAHLISFEGIDGVGKTTQAKRLYRRIANRDGVGTVELFREPGATAVGERIHKLLLLDTDIDLAPLTQTLLFNAARCELIRRPLARAVLLSKWVILDRYIDSTIAYQCYGHGIDLDGARIIQDIVVGDVLPALTFILDMPPEQAAMRLPVQEEKDRFHSEKMSYMNRVWAGYRQIAAQYPSRCVLLDVRHGSEEEVGDAIWRNIEHRLL